ncbi:ATP-dependent Clp protease proteolytic subunit [Mycobacteroides abscessus]|nr:ATP-dependent Clp protease proteolytic subunit [Mycobacteroides abscessus]MDM2408493.1 ATP-dependent Clp protease proteolytic subunit [Mycobacteroides abscessus]
MVTKNLKAGERPAWYSIRNAAKTDDGPAELLIYDEIDSWYGISADQFARDLKAIDNDAITVRINSPGGSVFDGIAILNALRDHPATVTVVVDSLAASIASVIAMAGDEIVMNRNSQMMLHNAWAVCVGDTRDMEKSAARLAQHNTNIAQIYADRAGGTAEDWLAVMAEETWLLADEAVVAGLADRVIELPEKESDSAAARASVFDLSAFRYAGRQSAPAPRVPLAHNKTPQPETGEVNRGKEPIVATLNEGLAKLLGIPADATDETILSAATEALEERAEDTDETPPAAPTLEQATALVAKAGLTVVEKAQYEATVAAARAGAEARAQQLREGDERVVDQAIRDGKVAPARRDHHLQALAADREGHAAVLAALAPGLIPYAETGHSTQPADGPVPNDLSWFDSAPTAPSSEGKE